MPLIAVETVDDPRIWPYRDLVQRNLTRQSGRFIAEGQKVVERLIASDFAIDSLLAELQYAAKYEPQVPPETPIYVASSDLLMATMGFHFHRGVVACGRRKPRSNVSEVMAK